MTKINILDLFSGIGGFSQGLKQAGFEINKHYHAEIDKHANAIYRQQFPDAEQVGDVRHIRADQLERIDVITFGSPCQDFSLAGQRKGLDGERSSLVTEAIRLIDECRPKFFIWENVKGTFSSNAGADFWAIIKDFANLGGYRLEWQLLNTSWFLPQNRERIYLVGRIADRCCGDVFPLGEETTGADERSEQAITVRYLTAGGNSGGMHSSMTLLGVGTMRNFKDENGNVEGFREIKSGNAPTIPARARGDGSGQPVVKVADRKEKRQNGRRFKDDGEPAFTLTAQDKHGVAVNERIRRLTEIECERLQGFPDNWTQYGNYDGETKAVSATQRYKCLGNAVTVDVVETVGRQILANTKMGES